LYVVSSDGATNEYTVQVLTTPWYTFQVRPLITALATWDPAGPAPPRELSQTIISKDDVELAPVPEADVDSHMS